MVNYNFLLEWCNDEAGRELFGLSGELDPKIGARSIFKLALNSDAVRAWTDRDELLRFLLSLAKRRLLYTLLNLGLPIHGKPSEGAAGLAFDFLAGGSHAMAG